MADQTLKMESHTTENPYIKLQQYLLDKVATNENIPSGILHRCSVYSDRIREFTGDAESRLCSQGEWGEIYQELSFSHLYGPALMPLDLIKERTTEYINKGLTPILVSDFNFEIVRNRFWATVEQHLADKLPAEAFPLSNYPVDQIVESKNAFFAAAFVKTNYEVLTVLPRIHYGSTVSFIIPRYGYFSNHSRELPILEVDFGVGKGYQPIQLDEPQVIEYSEKGIKTIRLRCSIGSAVQYAAFTLEVALPKAPPPDNVWTLAGYQPYQGKTAMGHAWVYYGSVNGIKKTSLTQPVIVAEGFPGNYPLDYLWDRLNQQGLATTMLSEGRDLIILGFDDGSLPIQANAYVTVTCIQRTAAERIGTTPLQVGGASMGGLVTRYALTFMEHANIPHFTSRFFTIDSPHGGATISPCAQAFVQYTAGYSSAAGEGAKLLLSPAAQQMLLLWIPAYGTWGSGLSLGVSPLRTQFLSDLQSIGWMPKQLISAAVSDGVGTGAQNGDVPGALTASFESTACIWDNSYVFPLNNTTRQNFAWMEISKVDASVWTFWVPSGGVGYDTMPGGQTDVFKTLASSFPGSPSAVYPNACFIPTVSACAVNLGYFQALGANTPSDFNRYMFSSTGNLMHIELSPELASFLADFIRGN